MTIDEANEILKEHVDWCDPVKEVDTYDALKLGIEALKEVKWLRECQAWNAHEVLPGETDE